MEEDFSRAVRDSDGAKATKLRDPLHRLIHRILVGTIHQRGDSLGNVPTRDLHYLYCLIRSIHCNIAHCLAYFLTTSSGKQASSHICGGAYITQLADSYGLLTKENIASFTHECDTPPLDMRTLRYMKLVEQTPVGMHLKGRDGRIWDPVPKENEEEEEEEHEEEGPTRRRAHMVSQEELHAEQQRFNQRIDNFQAEQTRQYELLHQIQDDQRKSFEWLFASHQSAAAFHQFDVSEPPRFDYGYASGGAQKRSRGGHDGEASGSGPHDEDEDWYMECHYRCKAHADFPRKDPDIVQLKCGEGYTLGVWCGVVGRFWGGFSLQCGVARVPTTGGAHIPLYLYPFLNTTSKSRPFEYLRLTSLGVIGALVKVDDTEVISFLLSTEIIPLCLRTMEMGSELSKTVATFIVQKILLDDVGLDYICTTAERFFAVGRVLGNMVAALADQQSSRLLKHIIRCYLRLSDNPRACDALRSCLPDMLRDATFNNCLREDPTSRRWLQQLVHNVQGPRLKIMAEGGEIPKIVEEHESEDNESSHNGGDVTGILKEETGSRFRKK
ncbi:hypothetical protein E3N88_15298 [Mikania micrantha]|uniref:Cell differentiation protein rcd1 n=1 Tax=Mikania micrantha TaxID=192012 RepID=A0A5N6NWH0_9ASTR|nr:hypothetical protein E3N88_15298 [Mikania micrantha]